MNENNENSSFLDQIIEGTLEKLSEHTSFNEQVIGYLRELANSDGMIDSDKVISALTRDIEA